RGGGPRSERRRPDSCSAGETRLLEERTSSDNSLPQRLQFLFLGRGLRGCARAHVFHSHVCPSFVAAIWMSLLGAKPHITQRLASQGVKLKPFPPGRHHPPIPSQKLLA